MSTIGTPNFTNFLFIFPHTEKQQGPRWPQGCFPEQKGYFRILSGVKASRRFPHTKQAGMALQSPMEHLPHGESLRLRFESRSRISAGAARDFAKTGEAPPEAYNGRSSTHVFRRDVFRVNKGVGRDEWKPALFATSGCRGHSQAAPGVDYAAAAGGAPHWRRQHDPDALCPQGPGDRGDALRGRTREALA